MQNKKKHSRIKKFFKYFVVVIIGLIVCGFVYEQISELIDSKTLRPPGQMVQVGDHKLHIYCIGENKNGSSTVILEAGGGQAYTTWNKIQPDLSKSTKVCSYDRSGLGFSEPTKDERTNDEVVAELETLLKNANVPGPYILVGHSAGGFYIRLFAKRNLNEVSGLVLIDPSVEEQADYLEDPPLWANCLSVVLNGIIDLAYRAGVPRILMTAFPQQFGLDLDSKTAKIERSFLSLSKDKNKYLDGYKQFDNIQEIKLSSNFGNLPVVLLSAKGSQQMVVAQFGESAKKWHEDQAKRLSNNSKYIFVKNSGHFIQQDQPQIIIDQILSMVH